MNIKNSKKIFILGIKGAAMANIALILKKMGKNVAGSDIDESFITDEQLKHHHISIIYSFAPSSLPADIDLVLYSAAHGGRDNQQIVEALRRGIKVMHQAEFLGELLELFQTTIAVCGTHGKTTTSAMLAYCLKKLGAHPSYLVGTSSFNNFYGGDYGGEHYFVVEADEYGVNPPADITPKFQYLHPNMCIATNIDFDHPDVYADIQSTKDAFKSFFSRIMNHDQNNTLFLCADDPDLMSVAQDFPHKSFETFGFDTKADLQIINQHITEDHTSFELLYKTKKLGSFSLFLFGGKHISNAAGVILALLHLGFNSQNIQKAISEFTGAKRRFELVKKIGDMYLFDDYAHHPEEILSTLETARERFKNRRLVVIFQSHTYSRTLALRDEFIDALSIADYVFLSPIFPSAREKLTGQSISSADLADRAVQKSYNHFYAYTSNEDLSKKLKEIVRLSDIIFTMGAGDVYKLKDDIIQAVQ